MSSKHRDYDKLEPKYNVFKNKFAGWSFYSLCKHLGMGRNAVQQQMNRLGLTLEARPGHTLTEKDVETVTAAVSSRRAERLYGRSQRTR